MTKDEFTSWAIPALAVWSKTNLEIPTLDRKHSERHYEVSNLQLLTKSDNSRSQFRTEENIASHVKRLAESHQLDLHKIATLLIKEQ